MDKQKMKRVVGYAIMFVALLIPLYCFGTIVYQSWTQGERYVTYREQVKPENAVQTEKLSNDYNARLASDNTIVDPFLADGYSVDYGVLTDPDAVYGYLSIPKLSLLEPIYLGADDRHLLMGLAHVDGTQLPVEGNGVRSVIAGHRGMTSQVYFRHLDQLEAGDVLYFDNGKEIITYQMVDSEIILPSEWEKLQPKSDQNMMTLITCDPMFIFNKRLLVNFQRVGALVTAEDYDQQSPATLSKKILQTEKETTVLNKTNGFFMLYHGICIISVLGICWIIYKFIKLLKN